MIKGAATHVAAASDALRNPCPWPIAAQRVDAQRKRSGTQLRHKAAQREWRLTPKDNRISEDIYRETIQPRLASVTISTIATLLGVSIPYAADIRAGDAARIRGTGKG
jgi:hypothetical protein